MKKLTENAMKRTKFMTVLVALICAMASWAADYNVGTDGELRSAIANNNANITLTADIDLSNSTLSIATGTTVTIDLNGHKLDRRLTQRGESGGQVITVRSGARFYLSNGTLKGGWGGDGGGLVNEGGTANLTNIAERPYCWLPTWKWIEWWARATICSEAPSTATATRWNSAI